MATTRFHELITRAAAWSLSIALTAPVPGLSGPMLLLLCGITVYFADNLCNALFGRTVTFPITTRPEDADDYELARVFSGGYSLVLWLMLVIGAQWQAGG